MNDPLKQQQQHECGNESPSAYASAESSPSQSMATSLSMHSIPNGAANQEDEFVLVSRTAPAMQSSQSMNSFGGHHAPPSPTQYVNLAAIPSSMSVSGIDTLAKLEELNMQAFTSLPPIKSSPETVKEVIERVVKAEVEKQLSPKQSPSSPQPQQQQQPQPQTSPNSYKSSSVFSVLGRIFKSSSKNNEDKSKAAANLSPVSASSSSPNPENSPFKLLESNKHASPKCEEPVNSDVKEAAAMLFPAGGETTSIEKLVQLNDERGELDPILSPPRHHAPKPEPSVSPAAVSSNENMKVPASSQEFCMDLNLNIAASAALAVAAPVAICESSSKSNKSSPHHQCAPSPSSSNGNDHQRFTKNASTSSIHNDLKAILEESQLSATGGEGKKTESGSATSPTSTSKSVKKRSSKSAAAAAAAAAGASTDEGTKKPQEAPKPQREKKHRNKNTKSSEKKSPAATESLESKINVLELLMKTAAAAMAEASKPPASNTSKRGPHRYSREFLLQIRDERTKLIDNICPDIFRAHSYCISGSYWDPEKYFNAMLHGERLYDFVNNNVTSNKLAATSTYGSGPKSLPHTQQQQPHRVSHHHNNSYHTKFDNNRRWARRNPAHEMERLRSNGLNPLVNTKSGSWSHPNLSEVSQALSDKYLLDLVKNTPANMSAGQSPRHAGVDLMGMLNKKHTDEKSIKPMQPRHSPMILTAQELEFSQLFSPAAAATRKQQQQQSSRTPERNQATTSGSSPASSRSSNLSPSSLSSGAGHNGVNNSDDGGDNSSDAYKQLVRNLSNHPLSSAPNVPKSSTSSVPAVNQLFNSAAPKRDEKQQQEAVIKQLLNLSTTSNEEASTNRSKHYNRFGTAAGNKPKSYGPRKSPGSGHIDNLLRMKPAAAANGSNEHFSMILEKLMPTLSGHISPSGNDAAAKSDDIMKWFRSAPSSDHRL